MSNGNDTHNSSMKAEIRLALTAQACFPTMPWNSAACDVDKIVGFDLFSKTVCVCLCVCVCMCSLMSNAL